AFDRGRVSIVAPLNATQSLWAVVFAAVLIGRGEAIGRRLVVAGVLIVAGGAPIGAVRGPGCGRRPGADSELQGRVRVKLEGAPTERDRFPHLVVEDLLPTAFLARLSEAIPPVADFQPDDDVKANLRITDRNQYFARAPEVFRSAWTKLRDDVFRDV